MLQNSSVARAYHFTNDKKAAAEYAGGKKIPLPCTEAGSFHNIFQDTERPGYLRAGAMSLYFMSIVSN